ncbi:MAG: hypothetical protein GVY17_08390 [Cyanobacteria bacterium]|jgi:CheY-like chemotaxis protein|nr:hypothetical protein [Cyanobacteria bacterium GSL.Bin21]
MLEPDFQAHPPVILVVEDEKTLRLISKCALIQEGNTVQEARDGEKALAICEQKIPHLLLLDALSR